MAAPTHRFRTWANTEIQVNVDSAAKRIAALGSDASVAHGSPPAGGTPLDFDIIDISGAGSEVESNVKHIRWDVTADNGNTLVEDFRTWFPTADDGFDNAGTLLKLQPLQGLDGTPVLTEEYDVNAVVATYGSWVTMPAADPASINLWPSDEGTSMALSTGSDDAIMWALYLLVDELETTGTYEAATSGFEFRMTYQFSYS